MSSRGATGAEVRLPIIVIGTHRSGTTLLGRALAHHPEVAYWEEPRHVWSRGHNFRPDDSLSAADVTPRIKHRIQRQFARYVEAAERSRLAEKTPSNCLRLEFINEIFPDCLFVHIFRDGRAVVHSTDVMTRTRLPEAGHSASRLLGTPIWEWPAFVPRAWRTLGRGILGTGMSFWGPQPPGWREWVREEEPLVVLAKQWRYTLEPVLEFRDRVERSRWLDLRYESLVAEPERHATELQSFARLTGSREFEDHLQRECHTDRVDVWRTRLDERRLGQIRPILEPALERLGYEW